MKHSKLFITFCITVNSFVTYAQEYAVDKRATWLSGTAGFSSQGGELYGKRQNTFVLAPSFNHFVAKNFFIGAAAEFGYHTYGNHYTTILGIGPHLGLAGGNIKSTVFPYISAGLQFHLETDNYNSFFGSQDYIGTDLALGAGMVAALKAHLGLTFEAAFHLLNMNINGEAVYGTTTSIGIGLTGLFFKGTSAKPVPEKK